MPSARPPAYVKYVPAPKAPPPPPPPPAPATDVATVLNYAAARVAFDDDGRTQFFWHLIVATVLMLACFLTYSNSFDRKWTLDNLYIIKLDPRTKAVGWNDKPGDPVSPWGVKRIFTEDYWWPKGISGLYRPITSFTYWLNWSHVGKQIWDAKTSRWIPDPNGMIQLHGFHWVNLGLHTINTLLVYVLMLVLTRRFWVAVFTGLIFATHPIATESVTNIIGRADLFAAMWVLIGTLLYIRSTRSSGLWRLPWLIGVMLVLTLGVFSKESAIALAAVVVLYDVTYRVTLEDVRRAMPTLTVAFGLCCLPFAAAAFLTAAHNRAYPAQQQMLAHFVALLGVSLVFFLASLALWLMWARRKPLTIAEVFDPWKKYFLGYGLLVPPIIAMAWVRHLVFFNSTPPEEPFLDNPIRVFGWAIERGVWDNLGNWIAGRLTAIKVAGRLIYLMVWPATLSSDYSWSQIHMWDWNFGDIENWKTIFSLLVLLALVGVAIWNFRHNKAVFFFVALYLINYLPTSNFLLNIGSIMAERFMYLPLIAFAGILVITVDALLRKFYVPLDRHDEGDANPDHDAVAVRQPSPVARFAPHAILFVLVATLGVRAFFRNYAWDTDVTLWEGALRASPWSFRSYQSLAFALYEQGVRQNIDRMIALDETGMKIVDPLPDDLNSSRMYLHLGMYYAIKAELVGQPQPDGTYKDPAAATPWYRKSVSVLERSIQIDRAFNEVNRQRDIRRGKVKSGDEVADVGLAPVYVYLGMSYMKLGAFDQAAQAFRYARHLEPSEAETYINLAEANIKRNKLPAAAEALLQAIILDDSKQNAWQMLDAVFRQMNNEPTPPITMVRVDPNRPPRPQLNLHCTVVQDNFIAAYREFIRLFRAGRRDDMAMQARNAAVVQYKMPANLFDPVMNEPRQTVLPPDPVLFDPKTKPTTSATQPSGPEDLPKYPRTPTPNGTTVP